MENKDFGKIAVLMGGHSAEREVSLKSGQAVLTALLNKGVESVGIDTAKGIIQQLTQTQFDKVFIALHGRMGEDGVIQGLLEVLKLPYTGSGVLGSALTMDKLRTKQLWKGIGIPTPPWVCLDERTDFSQVINEIGLPLIVKPVMEGSSIGITKVYNVEQMSQAWQTATACHSVVIAERFIAGTEYTAAILGEATLPLIKLETPRDFYDYTAKYHDNQTTYLCPCGLSAVEEQPLQNLAYQAFQALGATGWGRVDFMCDQMGQPWFLEVNTIPGMTDHSLVPMAAKAAGIDFEELVLKILATV
jgi:D-alanine-D-alanine ligase